MDLIPALPKRLSGALLEELERVRDGLATSQVGKDFCDVQVPSGHPRECRVGRGGVVFGRRLVRREGEDERTVLRRAGFDDERTDLGGDGAVVHVEEPSVAAENWEREEVCTGGACDARGGDEARVRDRGGRCGWPEARAAGAWRWAEAW